MKKKLKGREKGWEKRGSWLLQFLLKISIQFHSNNASLHQDLKVSLSHTEGNHANRVTKSKIMFFQVSRTQDYLAYGIGSFPAVLQFRKTS